MVIVGLPIMNDGSRDKINSLKKNWVGQHQKNINYSDQKFVKRLKIKFLWSLGICKGIYKENASQGCGGSRIPKGKMTPRHTRC